jgi:hypothetical protein
MAYVLKCWIYNRDRVPVARFPDLVPRSHQKPRLEAKAFLRQVFTEYTPVELRLHQDNVTLQVTEKATFEGEML